MLTDGVLLRTAGSQTLIRFGGPARLARIDGIEPFDAIATFFTGQTSSDWFGIPLYRGIVYRGLYRHIDLVYRGEGSNLKSEFVVAPGGDPDQIRLEYEGATTLSISELGDLTVQTSTGEIHERKPVIYQESNAGRVPIKGRYRILGSSAVGFEVDHYDKSQPLVIDPTISYSTYLGGSGISAVTGVAVDRSGNLYATGWTEALNFPIMGAEQGANGGSVDAFVVKMNSTGTNLLYATYIGGRGNDRAAGIAVDSQGQAYITGFTTSTNFPLVSAIRSTLFGTRAAFALKLNASGNSLLYSTYLGGTNYDKGNAIAVDGPGNAYITGDTQSANFPVLNAFQSAIGGGVDVFVTKLSPSGSLVYSTYLGGAGDEHAGGIAVDSSGNAYIAGGTFSTNFPVLNAIQSSSGGGQDAFVTKLSAGGSALIYSTYLGGAGGSQSSAEQANAVAVDASGNAYAAGPTNSANFPVTAGSLRTTWNSFQDSFVVKLNPAGSSLVYGTYLGGSGSNYATGIVADSSANAYISGWTTSADFPLAAAIQTTSAGADDAFISKIDPTGASLLFSTLYGGSKADQATAIALDSSGNIFTGGQTTSGDFPLVVPYQASNITSGTGWLMRIGVNNQVGSSPSAQFVKQDTATQGSWKGVYGSDGYNVIGLPASNPSYVIPVPSGNSTFIWAPSTTDVRGLQIPGGSTRTAATWYTASQFTIDLPFTGTGFYQMAVYCVDWDNYSRAEALQILDINNNVLDTRTISGFTGGVWVVWNLSGHVQLRVTLTGGINAVISGIFFGTGGTTAPSGTAQFVKQDTATQGSWKGVYGADGFNVIGATPNYPTYVAPAPTGNSSYVWTFSTSDLRALQSPTFNTRTAGTWYTSGQLSIDLPFTGTGTYQMAVYCLDWDNVGRSQTLQILDANNNVLDTRNVSSFVGGQWLVWNLSGHVQLRVTRTGGVNAVISGIFFEP